MVNKVKEEIPKSMKTPQLVVEKVAGFMSNLTLALDSIHNEIKILETITATTEMKAFKLSESYYGEFYPIRTNLRQTRLELKKLAKETVNVCKKMRLFFDNKDEVGAIQTLDLELKTMHRFLTKSMSILEKADQQYQSAMAKLDKFEPTISQFERQITRMLDKSSADYDKWTKDVRGGVYGTTAAGTVGCIVADVLGAFGLCSSIYNAVAWPSAIGGVEAAIDAYYGQLERTKGVGRRIINITGKMSGEVGHTMKFLEEELVLINAWQIDVESLKDNIDDIPLEKVAILADVFIIGIDDLQASAQAFLDRPDNVFGTD